MKRIKENWLVCISAAILLIISGLTFFTKGNIIVSSMYTAVQKEDCCLDLKRTISSFEESFNQNLFGKSCFVEILGAFNRILNKQIVLDKNARYTVYKMNNGQLTWNYVGYDVSGFSENFNAFADKMRDLRVPLLFVQAPFKINKYDNKLPYGIVDETNLSADAFLNGIAANCDIFDLREEMNKTESEYSSFFYSTDHHWTAEAGLWASGMLARKLKNLFNIDLDVTHLAKTDYSYINFHDYLLGSQGKRTGLFYSGLDDFMLIEPKYRTDYIVTIPGRNITKTGDYSDSLLFKEYLGKNYYSDDPGRVYTGDNYALMIIENKLCINQTKVLLIKDSFSKSVIPSFASTCHQLHVIDLRTFKGSVVEYIKENDIDCTVVMYNPSVVVNPAFFQFDKK